MRQVVSPGSDSPPTPRPQKIPRANPLGFCSFPYPRPVTDAGVGRIAAAS